MVLEYSYKPIKGVYLASQFLLTALIRVPILILISIPRGLRPRPSWSFKQSILIRFMRIVSPLGPIMSRFVRWIYCIIACSYVSRAGIYTSSPDQHAIVRGEGVKGLWIEPVDKLVIGSLRLFAAAACVEPARIPGY